MGSMALQLRPFTVPDASDVFQRAMTLRDLADQRRYRQLQQQQLEMNIEEDRLKMQEGRNLRELFRSNPNATPQQVLQIAPNLGFKFLTEQRQMQTAATQAKTAELTQQQKERELAKTDLQDMIGDMRFIKALPVERRDAAFVQIQDKWNKRGKPLTVDTVPTDEELDAYMQQAYELKDRLDIQSKQQAIQFGKAEEERKKEKHTEDIYVKGPLERQKLEAETVLAQQRLEGREPATGTLREFKQVFYPGWLQEKGITQPTARDEMNAYSEFRELLRARIGGVPGVDVPYPTAVQQQKIETAKATAEAKPATEGERKALGFYSRLKDAEDVMGTLEKWIRDLGATGQLRLKVAPDWAQTEHGQIYKQAVRQFTEARLRKESGAVISPSEYAMSEITFFPQPGDTTQTLKRKSAARKLLLDAMQRESGRAYKEAFPDTETPPPTPRGDRPALSSFER